MKKSILEEIQDIYTTAITHNDKQNKQIQTLQERIEQLEKENEKLKDDNKVMSNNYSKMERWFYNNLNKAKEIINKYYTYSPSCEYYYEDIDKEAEKFLFS